MKAPVSEGSAGLQGVEGLGCLGLTVGLRCDDLGLYCMGFEHNDALP